MNNEEEVAPALVASKGESRFRPFVVPRLRFSVLSTALFSFAIALVLFVCRENEQRFRNPAVRGFLVGILFTFITAPLVLFDRVTVMGGKFHPMLFLFPLVGVFSATFSLSVPIGEDKHLGYAAGFMLSIMPAFGTEMVVNARISKNDHHKQLENALGPPITFVFLCFISVVVGYSQLIKTVTTAVWFHSSYPLLILQRY